jgi:signal transduction histidine kinase
MKKAGKSMTEPPILKELEKRIHDLEQQINRKTYSEQLTQTLFHVSDAVNTLTDLDKLFPFVYQALDQIMSLPNFYIAVAKTKPPFFSIPFCIINNKPAYDTAGTLVETGCLFNEIMKKEQPLVLNHTQLDERVTHIEHLPQIWMGVPLIQQQKPFGMIAVYDQNNPDAFDQKNMDILITVSRQMTLAFERKQSFDELKTIKNYLTNIINAMPSIIVGVDKNKCVTQWNLMAELETGLKGIEACNKNVFDVFPRLKACQAQIHESILYRKIKTLLKHEFIEDQEKRFEDIIIYPLSSDGMDGCVIRLDDITEQVRMETMVMQSEKMMSIGGVAAGMAHELKNPLSGMMQHAQVIYNRVTKDIPANIEAADAVGIPMDSIRTYMEKRQVTDTLDAIVQTGSRANRMIQNMLGFARQSEPVLRLYNLAQIIEDTLEIARKDHQLQTDYHFDDIQIQTRFDTIPDIPCDREKIQQVLFNLYKNGAQAMSGMGNTAQFLIHLFKDEHFACIGIENNGPVISRASQKRLFEPFYTTKKGSAGTGLGLSISYFIITTDHKGEMTVETTPEKHTRFTIKLPY